MRIAGSPLLPLREWINLAVISVDTTDEPFSAFGADPRNLAVTSDEFVASALVVARSLAVQIHRAEEEEEKEEQQPHNGFIEEGVGVGGGGGGHHPSFSDRRHHHRNFLPPAPGNDWAGHVTVRLSPSSGSGGAERGIGGDDDEGNLGEPLDFRSSNWENNAQGDEAPPYYLSVENASFSSSSMNCFRGGCRNGDESIKLRRIFSLGLVFYEIFSGGERPSKLPNGNAVSEMFAALPFSNPQGTTVNLANTLRIDDANDDVGDSDSLTDEVFCGEGQRRAKRSAVRSNAKTLAVSVDPLKLKGLPGPLCDLIANMVNCVDGDDEAYSRLSDVISDLQLMLDKPTQFLHDLDLEMISMRGLQLNETIFGRNAELATLQDSYRRSISGHSSECGLIAGVSGTGKSVLAQRLGSYITASGGLFLFGKYDQTQPTPFSAIAAAFNQYCDMLASEVETTRAKKVAEELNHNLGKEALHLVKVIPSLRKILGQEPIEFEEDQGCVDAQRRLRYLLCQFMNVISSSYERPVTLWIDDVQWADRNSIEVINQLLLISGSSFYFLACLREDDEGGAGGQNEGKVDHFRDMLSRVNLFGVNVTTVKLSCMDEGMINGMVSDLLCLSPRLTRTLSNIVYHKTKGNPFFVSRLILSLSKNGLLRLNLSRRRWDWDEEKIQSTKLSDDVVSFLISTIGGLPADVQSALTLMSCFGTRLERHVAEELEAKLAVPLIQPLETGVAEVLLDKIGESYIFMHDKIQEAVYLMIPTEDRCMFHFKCGVALVPRALESDDGGMLLFIAANQINNGGPKCLGDESQAVLIANLNMEAGEKAISMADFSTAHSFFDHGISFLRKKHWQYHYDLSLRLFDAAAKSAFAIGDFESLKLLTEQILKFGKSLEDQLGALYLIVSVLASASKVNESIEKGVSVLSQMGERFPDQIAEGDVLSYLKETQEVLCDVTDEQLLNCKAMTDQVAMMKMSFLSNVEISMTLVRPMSQPIATLKMVNISLSHGMSSVSPSAFAQYGALVAKLGNIREGYRHVKIALKLLPKVGSGQVSGQVYYHSAQIICYVEPAQAALELHLKGYEASMASGDTKNAMLNKLLHTVGMFWSSGLVLQRVKETYADCRTLMKQYNQHTWLTLLSILEISALTFVGSKDEVDRNTIFTGNPLFESVCQFQNLYVGFLFRQYDQMLMVAEHFFSFNFRSWSLLYSDSGQTFITGLVAFWVYRKTNDLIWSKRGHEAKLQMKLWAETSEWNFKGKFHLLEAEEYFSNNDLKSASISYESAILASKEHRFINDQALACELSGYFYFEQGQKDICLAYFLKAHEKYSEWGACAKSNALFEFVQQNIAAPSASTVPAQLCLPNGNKNISKMSARKRENMT